MELTKGQLNDALRRSVRVALVLLHADWCPACRRFAPTWEALQVPKYTFNIDHSDNTAKLSERLGIERLTIPKVIAIGPGGPVVWTGDSASTVDELTEFYRSEVERRSAQPRKEARKEARKEPRAEAEAEAEPELEPELRKLTLDGPRTFVFTGFTCDDLRRRIERSGGVVRRNVSRKTDLLIAKSGADTASTRAAQELDIPVVSYRDFIAQMEPAPSTVPATRIKNPRSGRYVLRTGKIGRAVAGRRSVSFE
jgi:hypothetical protein